MSPPLIFRVFRLQKPYFSYDEPCTADYESAIVNELIQIVLAEGERYFSILVEHDVSIIVALACILNLG